MRLFCTACLQQCGNALKLQTHIHAFDTSVTEAQGNKKVYKNLLWFLDRRHKWFKGSYLDKSLDVKTVFDLQCSFIILFFSWTISLNSTSYQARLPAELKHIDKRSKRN